MNTLHVEFLSQVNEDYKEICDLKDTQIYVCKPYIFAAFHYNLCILGLKLLSEVCSLRSYVCVYVCMVVCLFACIYIYKYVCMCVCIYVCKCVV